ncbi:MAG: hypothetical protein R2704_10325 [Microthrixaceae bacterium]|nr:hypothetical protein [Microthrixaceae bacterium]
MSALVAMQQVLAQQITADDPWPLIWVAWVVTFGTFAAYAFVLVRRGRSLSARVAPERRRFLSEGDQDGADHG